MKTVLSQFCEEFETAVRPLLAPLKDFAEALSEGAGEGASPALRSALPGFQDVSHQLRVLAEKVAEQQAYVLIFGPLKSGKSTLMNSIAGAYVSEVTALPAYPCMVYVSHAEGREFVVTRYDGDTQSFSAPASMRMQVNRDHAELADRIRRAEDAGTDFEPGVQMPEAIRRIDVKVPATDLAQSGAVLVDTPGLYSRMKFGYDRMTREFRDTAACAIFVVKTDNLFLEQVFEEFQDLLTLFSRIFLVVNLDTTKMDLRPDGSLAPSLEREDPVRILEAFETLAMSAPLKSALEEGRLRLYPVDLLRAASRRLQRTSGASAPGEDTDDFDTFLGDLTEYLNSSDYLIAFLGDSLRRARQLFRESRDLCEHPGVRGIVGERQQLAEERGNLDQRLVALNRLEGFDWSESFEVLRDDVATAASQGASERRARCVDTVSEAVDAWFEDGRSLQSLLDDAVAPALDAFQLEFAEAFERELVARAQDSTAGATIPDDRWRDLDRVDLRLGDFSKAGLVAVLPRSAAEHQELGLDTGTVPVRKGLWDWLLFRSRTSIRRGLFGGGKRPSHPISPDDKARRLGEAGRVAIREQLAAQLGRLLPKTEQRIAERLGGAYRDSVVGALTTQLGSLRNSVQSRLAVVAKRLEHLARLDEHRGRLTSALERAERGLEDLDGRYGETDPEALQRPIEGESGVLTPQAPPTEAPEVEAPEVELESDSEIDLEDQPFPSPQA